MNNKFQELTAHDKSRLILAAPGKGKSFIAMAYDRPDRVVDGDHIIDKAHAWPRKIAWWQDADARHATHLFHCLVFRDFFREHPHGVDVLACLNPEVAGVVIQPEADIVAWLGDISYLPERLADRPFPSAIASATQYHYELWESAVRWEWDHIDDGDIHRVFGASLGTSAVEEVSHEE